MSIFTRTTKRGTRIRLTGQDANNFFNALVEDFEKLSSVDAVAVEGVKPSPDASRKASCMALDQSQGVPKDKPEDMESIV